MPVNSSLNLRTKIELIIEFLPRVNADTEVDREWLKYVDEQRENDLVTIIKDEKLKEAHIFWKIFGFSSNEIVLFIFCKKLRRVATFWKVASMKNEIVLSDNFDHVFLFINSKVIYGESRSWE